MILLLIDNNIDWTSEGIIILHTWINFLQILSFLLHLIDPLRIDIHTKIQTIEKPKSKTFLLTIIRYTVDKSLESYIYPKIFSVGFNLLHVLLH
jgi:hypothetical protein